MPVYNGLTDDWHPTQILADFLTMREHAPKPLDEIAFCYLGDARFNMANTYLIGGAKLGMDVRIGAPKSLWPRTEIVDSANKIAESTGARITLTENVDEAVPGATSSPPTCGCRWARPTTCGRSGSSCCCPTR